MQHLSDKKILIVEDDKQFVTFVEIALKKEGLNVDFAYTGNLGLKMASENTYSLIIIDRLLPDGMDGLEMCRQIREFSNVPVIIFTALGHLSEKIDGFDSGANDYIVKPVDMLELTARVKAHLRADKNNLSNEIISYRGIVLNLLSREVKRNGITLLLLPKEFEILKLFMENIQQVIPKVKIFDEVWKGRDSEKDYNRIVEVHISNLRKKINLPGLPSFIKTVHGVGYIFNK